MSPRRRLAVVAVEVALAVAAERFLLHLLATREVVATLLAGGAGAPSWTVLAALAYLGTRFVVFLFLPGVVLAHLTLAALDALGRRRPGHRAA